MNITEIIGYVILLTPFLALFIFAWKVMSLIDAICIYLFTGTVAGIIALGMHLTGLGQ